MARTATTGVLYRHSRECIAQGRQATCSNGCNSSDTPWQAEVYSKRDRKKIRKRFATQAAAKGWRIDALKAVTDKKLRAPTSRTLHAEVNEWLAGAREGRILSKRNEPYKPAVLRNYELALRLRVLPELGDRKLADIDRADLIELKEQLLGEGHSGSTIRNSFVPLQAVYRRALRAGRVPVNPATDLELPTSGRRDRAANAAQATELLDAFLGVPQAAWATAFYAGVRRGELRALRVRNIDLGAGLLRVERGWDDKEGEIAPKSQAGTRQVFVLDALLPYLRPLIEERGGDEFVFGSVDVPFEPRALERKARRAWKTENARRTEEAEKAETEPVLVEWFGLHEARHSFSTFMDHAGISETRADRYMGHAAPGVAGRYRHLLPGQIEEDAGRLDEYLSGAVAGKVVEMKRPAVG
jgi:integrase